MKLKFLIDEDTINFSDISMFIGFPRCSFKCNIDYGNSICQNYQMNKLDLIDIDVDSICKRYLSNDLTKALVIGGLEPFDSPFDLEALVDTLRTKYDCKDTIVIYTGYTKNELLGNGEKEYENVNYDKLSAVYKQIISYKNIIIKYGRYIPGQEPHYDPILGVKLASDNQYAEQFI